MPFNFMNPAQSGSGPRRQTQAPAPPGFGGGIPSPGPPPPQGNQPPAGPPQQGGGLPPGMTNNAWYGSNQPGQSGPHARYQAEIDRISTELRNAQMQGASPAVIGALQAQMSSAQMAMREAGMKYGLSRARNKPNYGGGGSMGQSNSRRGGRGRGGNISDSASKASRDYDMMTQMFMALFGMGGGMPGGEYGGMGRPGQIE